MDAESEGEAGLRVSFSPRSCRRLKATFPVCQLIAEGLCMPPSAFRLWGCGSERDSQSLLRHSVFPPPHSITQGNRITCYGTLYLFLKQSLNMVTLSQPCLERPTFLVTSLVTCLPEQGLCCRQPRFIYNVSSIVLHALYALSHSHNILHSVGIATPIFRTMTLKLPKVK